MWLLKVPESAYCMQGASGCGRVGPLLPHYGYFPGDQPPEDDEVDCELSRRRHSYFRRARTCSGGHHYALHYLEMGVLDQVSV